MYTSIHIFLGEAALKVLAETCLCLSLRTVGCVGEKGAQIACMSAHFYDSRNQNFLGQLINTTARVCEGEGESE